MSMQWQWKAWLQLGSTRPLSPSSNSDRQTAQSWRGRWAAEEKVKVGRDLRTEGSRRSLKVAAEEEEEVAGSGWGKRWRRRRAQTWA